jgi:methyl-accepting chemotaxis protein
MQTLYREEEDVGVLIALGSAIIASSVPAAGAREASSVPALAGASHDPANTEEAISHGEREFRIAWQPLKSIDGTAIGAIGAARSASEMEGPAGNVRATIILVGAIAALAAGGAGFMFGRGLGARLDDLSQAAGRWSVGELSSPARDREPLLARWIPAELLRDEINQLAEQLDQTRESFRQAIERIKKR